MVRSSASTPALSGTSSRQSLPTADASVLSTVRGVPWWGAVLIAVVFAAVGAAVDALAVGKLGWGYRVAFPLGIAMAALAVRRGSIFTAMVQAPLVMAVTAVAALRILTSERIATTAIALVDLFPLMVIGTAVGLLLGLIRIFAQPLRNTHASWSTEGRHA